MCQFANGVLKAGVSQARPQALAAARDDDGEMVGKRMRIEDVMSPSSTAGNGLVGDTPGRNVASSGSSLGRIYVKGNRSRYLGIEDRMAMLDHVSRQIDFWTRSLTKSSSKTLKATS